MAVDRDIAPTHEAPGIVGKHINAGVALQQLLGQPSHLCKFREVRHEMIHAQTRGDGGCFRSDRPTTTTFSPLRLSLSAAAAPMPSLAPVMTTVRHDIGVSFQACLTVVSLLLLA